jgi:uncharacterized protein YndB with AHSA1/START domain
MIAHGDKTLRIERTYQAPAESVFDAWTSEKVMRRWWHAEHAWETSEAEVDLRLGGAVRVGHARSPQGRGGRALTQGRLGQVLSTTWSASSPRIAP